MIPVGHISTLQLMENDWMIYQYFLKNKKKIRIVGFGRNKKEALDDFNYELQLEKENIT